MSAETFLNGKVTMLLGDVREMLKTLPDDHFDCVVTSPPYWGLRDYGVAGQIGLEPTLSEHLAVMVDVFNEVRRVMKPTATLWLNYGDCYATSPNGRSAADTKAAGNDDRTFRDKPFSTIGGVLKPKDLCMIPNRLAIALQEAGWYVRSEIIWHKPNPMPESTRDRPTSAHEKIWLLTKSGRYFYDGDAIREKSETADPRRPYGSEGAWQMDGRPVEQRPNGQLRKIKMPDGWDTGAGGHGSRHREGREKGKTILKQDGHGRRHAGFNERYDEKEATSPIDTKNARNVWTIPPSPFAEAHFATFPTALAERCIKAGSPKGGSVLDIFGGAGTTALSAVSLGRAATLIELNPEYATLARARIEAAFMGKDEGARHMVKQLGKTPKAFEPGSLFAGIEAAE